MHPYIKGTEGNGDTTHIKNLAYIEKDGRRRILARPQRSFHIVDVSGIVSYRTIKQILSLYI